MRDASRQDKESCGHDQTDCKLHKYFHTYLSYLSFILILHTFTSVFMFRVTFFKSYDNSTSEKTKIRCHDRSQFRDCVYRGSDAILPRIAILVLLRTINTKQLENRQKSIRMLHIVPVQSISAGLNEENNDIPDENTMCYLPPSPPPNITRKTHGTPPDVLCPRPPGHPTLDLELRAEANGI